MKESILKPITTPSTLTQTSTGDKRALPPRQPLPTAVFDPTKAQLKLGLDVHLEILRMKGGKRTSGKRAQEVHGLHRGHA